MSATPFADRRAAGRALAARLAEARWDDPVVLALPRGGVPVAVEVAQTLGCPLDLLLVRKIGAPYQPEFAIAAVVDGKPPRLLLNPALGGLAARYRDHLDDARRHAEQEIARRRRRYLGEREPVPVEGRTAILVDDGLATGTTMRAAVAAMRARGAARVVVAVPVAPPDAIATFEQLADDVVCLETPQAFTAVGAHYADFHQVGDDEVVALLDRTGATTPGHPGATAARAPRAIASSKLRDRS